MSGLLAVRLILINHRYGSACYRRVCVPDMHTLCLSGVYNGARVHTRDLRARGRARATHTEQEAGC